MNILIITSAKFPEGDAESVRLHTIGKILRDNGANVNFIGLGNSEYKEINYFDDFEYVSLRRKVSNQVQRVYYYLNYTSRLKKYLSNYLNKNSVQKIIFADLSPIDIRLLKSFSKRHNIELIADCVEWYSPEQFKYGNLSPSMIMKNIENKYVIDKTIKIIAISKYLYNYFGEKGCKCVRIPVLLDIKQIKCIKQVNNDKLNIFYAGSPGRKDYIEEILKGILLLNDEEVKELSFVVAGVNQENIRYLFHDYEMTKLNKCVKFLGRIPRSSVLEKLSQADFTVLLRAADKRYAKAGFPTKVVESLATATPVILNYSSDLDMYIKHKNEGLIVSECSSEEFAKTLKLALSLSEEEKNNMKRMARVCAEKNFDYRIYRDVIDNFWG